MTAGELDFLSVSDLLEIATSLLDDVAVRDAGLLAAAAARPLTTGFGQDAYPTFEERAAALLHSLVRTHALFDDNLLLAWSVCRVFHLMNSRDLTHTVDDAEQMVLAAAGGHLDVSEIAAWLSDHVAA